MMFTIDQIKAAHSKVKSGADFPAFIQDLIQLGVLHYETFVHDGHTDYYGKGNYKTSSPPRYDILPVSGQTNTEHFTRELKAHQQGKTDYPGFCKMSADTGVAKWIVDTGSMTCTYYDKAGNEILKEMIPQGNN